jgi:chromate transport protein ChrA
MAYTRGILSGLAAVILAELVPALWFLFRGANGSKATGLAAIAGALLESIYTPLFWILSVSLFLLFFVASRLRNKPLRVIFFWIPTVTTSCVGVTVAAFFAYLLIHFRNS